MKLNKENTDINILLEIQNGNICLSWRDLLFKNMKTQNTRQVITVQLKTGFICERLRVLLSEDTPDIYIAYWPKLPLLSFPAQHLTINPHFIRLIIVYTASLNKLLILQKIFNRTGHSDKNDELLIHTWQLQFCFLIPRNTTGMCNVPVQCCWHSRFLSLGFRWTELLFR